LPAVGVLVIPVIWIETGVPELSDVELREYVRTPLANPTVPPLKFEGVTVPTAGAPPVAVGTVIVTDETAEVELVVKV
jgi:hypothetical protein